MSPPRGKHAIKREKGESGRKAGEGRGREERPWEGVAAVLATTPPTPTLQVGL